MGLSTLYNIAVRRGSHTLPTNAKSLSPPLSRFAGTVLPSPSLFLSFHAYRVAALIVVWLCGRALLRVYAVNYFVNAWKRRVGLCRCIFGLVDMVATGFMHIDMGRSLTTCMISSISRKLTLPNCLNNSIILR